MQEHLFTRFDQICSCQCRHVGWKSSPYPGRLCTSSNVWKTSWGVEEAVTPQKLNKTAFFSAMSNLFLMSVCFRLPTGTCFLCCCRELLVVPEGKRCPLYRLTLYTLTTRSLCTHSLRTHSLRTHSLHTHFVHTRFVHTHYTLTQQKRPQPAHLQSWEVSIFTKVLY